MAVHGAVHVFVNRSLDVIVPVVVIAVIVLVRVNDAVGMRVRVRVRLVGPAGIVLLGFVVIGHVRVFPSDDVFPPVSRGPHDHHGRNGCSATPEFWARPSGE